MGLGAETVEWEEWGLSPGIQRWGTRREEEKEALRLVAQSWEMRAWFSVPAPSLACCVISGKCVALSGPHLPHFVTQGGWVLWI